MAVVKITYVKTNCRAQAKAKATIRYIQNRRGADKTKTSRVLFGRDGALNRQDAYRMIDEAGEGSVFFRFIISPDPTQEDGKRDLHLREITETTMLSLEEQIKQQIAWVATEHADHAPNRHVHIVAVVPSRLHRQEFQLLPKLMRQAATQACVEQRRERDLQHQKEQAREEASWEQE